jgi:hypothetical protein
MAASAAILPQVQFEPEPRIRWFRADGCVEERPDGTFSVYVGGSLIGTFSQREPAERDILIALLVREPRTRLGKVAWAFRVSRETVRRARLRATEGGLAAIAQGRRRGAPSKRTPMLRRRVYRLFEQGLKLRAVHRTIKGRVSYSTVRSLYREWQAERERGADRNETTSETAPVLAGLAACAGNDTSLPPAEAEVAEPAQAAASERTECAADRQPEAAEEEVELAAEQARSEMSLEEAAGNISGQTVQHAGTWIMLGMLHALGLYAVAKDAGGGSVPQVALRVALDAVAITLSLGQRCVEGVRRLATPCVALLLRSKGAISASWTRRVLKCFAKQGSAMLHLEMARSYLRRARREDGRVVLYVDNHLRPYTGKHTVRKGWRMQDKRARPGVSDYYVHDEDGRPLFRVEVASHDSLTTWLRPVAGFARSAFTSDVTILLAFDRAGAFAEEMAELRDQEVEFTTYERAPYAQYSAASFDRTVTLTRESKPKEPVVIQFTDERQKNLGKGRGRVGRIAMRMPDGKQVNILTVSKAPAEELIRIQLQRWGCQENQLKHGNERWAINQLDGRTVEPYPLDAIIPNPARNRLDRALRLARAAEGEARRKLARVEADDPKRAKLEQDLQRASDQQQELEALRPEVPTHAPVRETELADKLVYHHGEYKTVIDTLRIGLANAESELATELAPHLLKPREAKKTLANLLAAPGVVRLTPRTVTVSLLPAATARERKAFEALLHRINARKLTLPGDPSRRRLLFRLQT